MPLRQPRDEARVSRQRSVGRRIRRAREEMGATRADWCQQLGYTQSWLQGIETGVNGIDALDLERIARITGYPVDYFVNPNFDARQVIKPQTRGDWDTLYPERPEVAALHWEIDRKLNGVPTPFRHMGPRTTAA